MALLERQSLLDVGGMQHSSADGWVCHHSFKFTTLLAEVIATRTATFMEKRDMKHNANSSKVGFVRTERIRFRSHWGAIIWTDGKVLMRCFQNLAVSLCVKTE